MFNNLFKNDLDVYFHIGDSEGNEDFSDGVISSRPGVLVVRQSSIADDILADGIQDVLLLELTARGKSVTVDSINITNGGLGRVMSIPTPISVEKDETYTLKVRLETSSIKPGDLIGVEVSSAADISVEKGKVTSMELIGRDIKVVLAIDQDIQLPSDSEVAIRSVSYVASDRYIKIIPGIAEEYATEFVGRSDAFDLEEVAVKLDSLFADFGDFSFGNISDIAQDLSDDIDNNMKRLVGMLKEPTSKLDAVIEKTEHVVVQLDSLTALMQGDGTIGKMMRSDSLYEELRESNQALKDLLEDIKENPARYLKNIKIL